MSKSGHGGGGGGKGGTRMTPQAASRIQSAGAKTPGSPTAQSGFAPRAQSAAATGTQGGGGGQGNQ